MKFAVLSLPIRALIYCSALLVLFSAAPASALETLARQAILLDTSTGAVLFNKNADEPMAPASMSKMMTAYMLFERLREGRMSLEDTFPVSENAWRKGGAKSGSSTMFLEPGKRVKVEDLIRGIIVQSGNDACIVVAEALEGSEAAFANEMTARARQLGMKNSVFKNATGWPEPEHLSTARDLALLAQKIIEDFPEYYSIYSEKSFTYNGINQINRNPLLYKDMGADGVKTGHTSTSGYGLTASVKRGDRRLILVVNGLSSKKERAREPERLLEWGFRSFNNYELFKSGETVVDAEVWLGTAPTVPLVIENNLTLTLARKARKNMSVKVVYNTPVPAPVTAGTELARLVVSSPNMEPVEVPLIAGNDVAQLGLMGRLSSALKHILWGSSN
ncbi:MAG: D-alanyl-D-alanine carboxypeptidase [Rhodospirillales bacterium]|nr:D-alanyl-D-alanine carboxypeptidase [Rhodospirillales bacterium]